MDLHLDTLDRHFSLPKTGKVEMMRPFSWLRRGAADFMAHPLPSLGYGILTVLTGWLVLLVAASYVYLSTFSVTGYLLLAPLCAAGIYELTSEREEGRETSFAQSIHDLMKNFGQLAFMGAILGMIAIAWERVSAILFALFYGGEAVTMDGFIHALTGEYALFTVAWFIGGLVLACVVFALTAVSIPMLADREVDVITAMMTSVRVVAENLPAMLLWAATIVVLTVIGFATFLVGFAVIFPILGHATWIAYKDLVK
ncbi:Uncharacterized membrane protein [Andreprevotia lacus DSM 23236]|jgi:uncharacterized membrane protein|uniref:Uncharacterized membrane protein n=1 Tax=Andreprevotia lacus DSM 23236 TaxID=1121001 RepID=A0A1W1XZ91_9NEIS|nr:DUF2189 domain-containing protein [Andreprevotia lacus]SMC29177.1 Uncharacterized membrane protein [Andreprevotia lacus DSM 23236]